MPDEDSLEAFKRTAMLVKHLERVIDGHTDAVSKDMSAVIKLNAIGALFIRVLKSGNKNIRVAQAVATYPWGDIILAESRGLYEPSSEG